MKKRISYLLLAFLMFLPDAYAQNNNNHSFLYLHDILTQGGTTTGTIASTWNSVEPFKYWSLSVNPTTTAGQSWDVRLEGSLDNVYWTPLVINSTPTYTAGQIATNITPVAALYLRTRASGLTAGLSVTATAVGTW